MPLSKLPEIAVAMNITGTTRVFFIIADPIGQVRTPELFNAEFHARQGKDVIMAPLHVSKPDFDQVWRSLQTMKNFGGCIVTVPHKQRVVELADEASLTAQHMNAANAVRREADGRMVCDNFDGAGFIAGLHKQGHQVADKRILLVGAGGAGSAIAYSVAKAGAEALAIHDIAGEKQQALIDTIIKYFASCECIAGSADPGGFDMVVNATPLGMQADDLLSIDVEKLTSAMTVVDVIMKPAETRLLQHAKEIGCPIQYGRHMLEEQLFLQGEFLGI